MDRGTYVAASAGYLNLYKLDVVANNLANVDTPGYKRQVVYGDEQTFDETLAAAIAKDDPFARGDHERSPGVTNVKTATDFTIGSIKQTGNPLDVALRNPKDFFTIQTPDGIQYTRAGNFTLNAEGEIVTHDGMTLIGDGGAVNANGPNVQISPGGGVMVNGELISNIQVVRFQDTTQLERTGSGRFKLAAGAITPETVEAQLEPKSLEMSNVSTVSSMVDLISANRAFEMYTKTARSIDEMNQTTINQVGKSR
ncbi:MAG: flagellar hook-basal body protein [Bdellovibrionales bacterium]|nr:flagellar hook-basal body protein [Bdellovibrionales bacterium]